MTAAAAADASVIVVHGVGDPMPADALNKLIEGLTASGWKVSEPVRVEHLRERAAEANGNSAAPQFPMATASLSAPDGRGTLRIREVYWGDLSRPKASLFGLVSALLDLVFGLRFIVTAAANHLSGLGHWGAQFARASLWWARGPMLALNILAAVISLTYVALMSMPWPLGGMPPVSGPLSAVLLGSLLVFVAGWVVRNRAKELQWSPATGLAMVVLALGAPVAGWVMRGKLEMDLSAFIGGAAGASTGVTDAMVLAAALMAALALVALLLCILAAPFSAAKRRRTLAVVAFCTSLALGLFTLVAISFWVLLGRSLREDKADLTQRCLSMPAEALQNCLLSKIEPTPGTVIADRVDAGIHLLPWVVFGFAVMAICYLLVVLGNWYRARRHHRKRFRYIVNWLVFGAGVSINALYGFFFLWLAWTFTFGGLDKLPAWVKAEALKPFALSVTVVLVSLVVATRSHFLVAIDLVLDVIAHFRTENERLLGRGGRHYVWERAVSRFYQVLERELDAPQRSVVVVSHSQGTTIAAHGLGALRIAGLPASPPKPHSHQVSLVTMGSPIEHLYRYYMEGRYKLRPTAVGSWQNIYRDDDYIGTTIMGLGGAGGDNVGPGGHGDYWSDSRVVALIVESIDAARRTSAGAPREAPSA